MKIKFGRPNSPILHHFYKKKLYITFYINLGMGVLNFLAQYERKH